MPLHIKDEATTRAVRKLAASRGLSLTAAVRVACEEALHRDRNAVPLAERVKDIQDRVAAARGDAPAPPKERFDEGWGGL